MKGLLSLVLFDIWSLSAKSSILMKIFFQDLTSSRMESNWNVYKSDQIQKAELIFWSYDEIIFIKFEERKNFSRILRRFFLFGSTEEKFFLKFLKIELDHFFFSFSRRSSKKKRKKIWLIFVKLFPNSEKEKFLIFFLQWIIDRKF